MWDISCLIVLFLCISFLLCKCQIREKYPCSPSFQVRISRSFYSFFWRMESVETHWVISSWLRRKSRSIPVFTASPLCLYTMMTIYCRVCKKSIPQDQKASGPIFSREHIFLLFYSSNSKYKCQSISFHNWYSVKYFRIFYKEVKHYEAP